MRLEPIGAHKPPVIPVWRFHLLSHEAKLGQVLIYR